MRKSANRTLVALIGAIIVLAGKADAALADIDHAAVAQFHPVGVAVDVEAVAAVALQRAAPQGDVLGAFDEHRPAAMDGVIAHARRPVGLEIGRGGVRDPQAAERDMVYGMGLGSPELDHALIQRRLDDRGLQVHTGGRHVVELAFPRVEEPLAGRVQLFQHVLHVKRHVRIDARLVHLHVMEQQLLMPAFAQQERMAGPVEAADAPLAVPERDLVETDPLEAEHHGIFGMGPLLFRKAGGVVVQFFVRPLVGARARR